MENGKSKFDRDNTLIWVCCSLLAICAFQMYFTLQFKKTIREQEVVIKKLEPIKTDTTEVDSLRDKVRQLTEKLADADERCAIQLDELHGIINQYEYDKNNPKK